MGQEGLPFGNNNCVAKVTQKIKSIVINNNKEIKCHIFIVQKNYEILLKPFTPSRLSGWLIKYKCGHECHECH